MAYVGCKVHSCEVFLFVLLLDSPYYGKLVNNIVVETIWVLLA